MSQANSSKNAKNLQDVPAITADRITVTGTLNTNLNYKWNH